MEGNKVRTLNIKGLPKAAVGVHTVKKVLVLEEIWERWPISYAIILLDNLVTFHLEQRYHSIAGPAAVCLSFSPDEFLLLMSEGKTFNLQSY